MHSGKILFSVIGLMSLLLVQPAMAQSKPAATAAKGWKLVWSDEFNGPDGSQPDATKWTLIESGNGFGNNELEYYTTRPENAHIEHGSLVISAFKEKFKGADGERDYTSARMQTRGHFEQQYGRFEARIKTPGTQGIWPAFWLLGANFDTVGWPACGEIDIMEKVGFEPNKIHGTLHGPLYSGGDPLTGAYTLPAGKTFMDDYHVYAVEWDENVIRFYVDNVLYETQNSDNIPSYKHWAFNHPFFVLLNLAVGGKWPGNPDTTTVFPARMYVDYVRVYERAGKQQK